MIELEQHWIRIVVMAVVVASVHIWFPWFDRRFASSRPYWSAFVGGFALGYVLLYMLPKLSTQHQAIMLAAPDASPLWKYQTFEIMLISIVVYVIVLGLRERAHAGGSLLTPLTALGRASYSFLVGYLLVELPPGRWLPQLLVCSVFIFHLIGLDSHLRARSPAYFERILRWMLAVAVLAGMAVGLTVEFKAFTKVLTALLAGGILVVVMSEELPGPSHRLTAFVAGTVMFVAISTVLRSILLWA